MSLARDDVGPINAPDAAGAKYIKKSETIPKKEDIKSVSGKDENTVPEITDVYEKKAQTKVDSLIELSVDDDDRTLEAEIKQAEIKQAETKQLDEKQAEDLKQSIIKEIKEDPEKIKKVTLKNIDGNLLLAMLSLRT